MLKKQQILQIYFQDHPIFLTITPQNLQQQLNIYFKPQQIQILYENQNFLRSQNISQFLKNQILMYQQRQAKIDQLMMKLLENQPQIKIQYKKLDNMIQSIIKTNFCQLQNKCIKNTLDKFVKSNEQKIINATTVKKQCQKIEEKQKSGESFQKQEKYLTGQQNISKNEDEIKSRLKTLFQLYTKKQFNQNRSKTFQQIQQKVKSMNLNIWMRFNRDFKVLQIIEKQQIYKIFKIYSINRILTFDQFYQAIKNILANKTIVQLGNPWKYLSISQQELFNKKLKELGVPFVQNQNHKKSDYILPHIKKIDKKQEPTLHKINMTFENLDISKLSNLKLKHHIPIQKQQEDSIYLKQYNIQQKKDKKKNFIKNNQKIQRQGSEGILNRMDQRIKKYLRH